MKVVNKKFYASHSNFQHIKEIVSESDETDFSRKSDETDLSRKSATHGYAYSSVVQILKERKLFLLLKLIENFWKSWLWKERKIQVTWVKNCVQGSKEINK